MSLLSDLLVVGAVAVGGWYIYNVNKPIKDTADTITDIAVKTVLPQTITPQSYRATIERIEDNTGVDLPELPDPLVEVVKKDLESPLPLVVSEPTNYITEKIIEESKKPLPEIVQDVTQSKVSNPGGTLAGLVSDVVTGNYKWTGFKLPF